MLANENDWPPKPVGEPTDHLEQGFNSSLQQACLSEGGIFPSLTQRRKAGGGAGDAFEYIIRLQEDSMQPSIWVVLYFHCSSPCPAKERNNDDESAYVRGFPADRREQALGTATLLTYRREKCSIHEETKK